MMLLLPPPLSPRDRVIVAARRRGLSVNRIGDGLNISFQAIEQRLAKIEKHYGRIPCELRHNRSHRGRQIFRCDGCGKLSWSTPIKAQRRQFCTARCHNNGIRIVWEQDIVDAIDMRRQGYRWIDLSQLLDAPVQTIQIAIWRYLHHGGLLKMSLVKEVWHTAPSRRPAQWAWLEKRTGWVPE